MPLDLQPIDVLLLVILALAALSGWRRGFAMVLLGYLGLLVGLALGAWAATQAGLLVSADSSVRRLLTAVVVFFLVAAACHAVGNLLGSGSDRCWAGAGRAGPTPSAGRWWPPSSPPSPCGSSP